MSAEPVVLDDFESAVGWQVLPSDGVGASVETVDGVVGRALRLRVDFRRGSGFCVIRRALPMKLPANYRFAFAVRGELPANNLEFKLVDTSGENVWWLNRRRFAFPPAWRTLQQRRRHIQFAWGPVGGGALREIGAIEFAIASAEGGSGWVDFDRLTFEELPEPQPVTHEPLLRWIADIDDQGVAGSLDDDGRIAWRQPVSGAMQRLDVDFQQVREVGGVMIAWGADAFAGAYDVSVSYDGEAWQTAATVAGATGGRDYVPLPDAEGRYLRITPRAGADAVQSDGSAHRLAITHLRFYGPEFAESPNEMLRAIAADAPRGWYPRYFLNEQQPWTVVGVPNDSKEALIDAGGAIEVDRGAFRLEPFLYAGGRLVTWADADPQPSLADGYLPIPSVTWTHDGVRLKITALTDGEPGASRLLGCYELSNTNDRPRKGALFVAFRPYQVLPPWQNLNITGGVSRVSTVGWDGTSVQVGDQNRVRALTPADAFGATSFVAGRVCDLLARGVLPKAQNAEDPMGLASGALRFDYDLPAGGAKTVVLAAPFHERGATDAGVALQDEAAAHAWWRRTESRARQRWDDELGRVTLRLPASAAKLVNTYKSTIGHILINADGPSIQPGSRTYERSWIRDGAMTSTALLYTGHADRVRAFIEWYAPHQYDDGKVPCVVDQRGPDPVPEHDSTGQLIYLLWKYYQFTGDREFLGRYLPNVEAGVAYIESLRAQRMTDTYRNGTPEQRACFGLVPESISHEGYSAKPMHSYWDSFFVLRGLTDAAEIAHVLEKPELEGRFARGRDEYRAALRDSIELAMKNRGIDFVPGCVELGDFDATSTAIAYFPCDVAYALPGPALSNTFERYYRFFRERRDGELDWVNYTPYEIRLVGTMLRLDAQRLQTGAANHRLEAGTTDHRLRTGATDHRLEAGAADHRLQTGATGGGRSARAHELLDFFFADQSPPAWNQWAEVVWRDPMHPGFVGDMPHTWVGSAYINAVRSMFVYEHGADKSLILAAGVRREWVTEAGGVEIRDWPTEFGTLSYALRADGNQVTLDLSGDLRVPDGGMVFFSPLRTPIESATVNGEPARTMWSHAVRVDTSPAVVRVKHASR